jgi:hypothetical protein
LEVRLVSALISRGIDGIGGERNMHLIRAYMVK